MTKCSARPIVQSRSISALTSSMEHKQVLRPVFDGLRREGLPEE